MRGHILRPDPSLKARWQSPSLEPRAIERELVRLWGERQARQIAASAPGATAELPELRTSTVNLIAVADSVNSASRLESAIMQLHDFAPARALILTLVETSSQAFDIETMLREVPSERGRTPVRFEIVRVSASPDHETSLASIASPLLLPELPTVLFWPVTSLINSPLFAELTAISDRLIIDSSLLTHPLPNLRELSRLVGSPRSPVVSDFAWRRLTPWRSLLAQFFDSPDAMPELDRIDEVELISKHSEIEGQSGTTACLMLAGWLATSLGWRAPGPLVRAKDGWRVTLRTGSGRNEREVLLRLRHKTHARSAGRVLSIMLRSDDDVHQPSLFRVERVSREMLRTYSEFGGRPPVTRSVTATIIDDSDLLEQDLASLGRDSVYESALRFAVTLMPEEG